jgi:hypothetical protein
MSSMSETFVKSASLIRWNGTVCKSIRGRIEIATKPGSVKPAGRFAISEVDKVS